VYVLQSLVNVQVQTQVTIGVVTRNNAGTIAEAIQSIKGQDYPHELLEVIIVDGSSQDQTLVLARNNLLNADIRSKFLEEHAGLGYARQLVVKNADGKYIVWVDGDMTIPEDFVSRLVAFIAGQPEIGIAKGRQALEPGGNLLATLEAYSRIAGKMVDHRSEKSFSKVLGTSGCIYRTSAIRGAGGFDPNLKGYCEDWDAEIKVKSIGWRLDSTNVVYRDYERNSLTWKSLWKRYWLRGYYTHYFLHKNPGLIKHSRMFPPAAFLAGLLNARKIFRVTAKMVVYLMPLESFFKFTAWYVGFLSSHRLGYEPKPQNL
jgi:glycosyltransferase involved in cell wall biosynthesis